MIRSRLGFNSPARRPVQEMHPQRDISVHRFAAWLVGPLAIVAALFWAANHIGGNIFAVKAPKTDCIPNERFVNDPDGRRFLELRWLMDPPGWRVRLRVPAEYVTWADVGCESAAMPGYPDPNYTKPYAQGFAVGLSLPDFKPLPPAERNIDRNGVNWSKMVVHIDSIGQATSESERRNVIPKMFEDIHRFNLNPNDFLLKDYNLTAGQKPSKYGLERIGIIGIMENIKNEQIKPPVYDFYYTDKKPIELWFKCIADEIKDHSEDPSWDGRPECEMHFRHARIDSVIKVEFPKIYMPVWQQIKVRTEWLLDSFEIGELNEGKL